MKLIKCTHCGRPYYNEEKACPYCGHATHLSATNFITKSITSPQSHKLMEDVFSGNYHPAPNPVHVKPVEPIPEPAPIAEPEPVPAVECETPIEQPVPEPDEGQTPSESVQERADNIAAVTQQEVHIENESENENELNEVETVHVPRKRHRWIWILIIVILLAIAAVAYLKWDDIQNLINSILN